MYIRRRAEGQQNGLRGARLLAGKAGAGGARLPNDMDSRTGFILFSGPLTPLRRLYFGCKFSSWFWWGSPAKLQNSERGTRRDHLVCGRVPVQTSVIFGFMKEQQSLLHPMSRRELDCERACSSESSLKP